MLCNILLLTVEARLPLAEPVRYTVEGPKIEEVGAILRNAGGFDLMASLFDAIDISILPSNITVLVPKDFAASRLGVLTFAQALPIVQYHVLTRQLPFSDLKNMPAGSIIETLLRNRTVQITSNNPWRFTVDNVQVTNSDMFLKSGFVIHGLNGMLAIGTPSLPSISPASPHLSPKNASLPSLTKPPASQSIVGSPSRSTTRIRAPLSDLSFASTQPAPAPVDTVAPKHKNSRPNWIVITLSVSLGVIVAALAAYQIRRCNRLESGRSQIPFTGEGEVQMSADDGWNA